MLGNKPDLTTEHILHTTLGITFVSLSFTTCGMGVLIVLLQAELRIQEDMMPVVGLACVGDYYPVPSPWASPIVCHIWLNVVCLGVHPPASG